jgi:hypothetical protein
LENGTQIGTLKAGDEGVLTGNGAATLDIPLQIKETLLRRLSL